MNDEPHREAAPGDGAERRIETPTEAQIAAADPRVSAWVAANAGSGKTRVLTQRVARLLLAGAAPERILCLTFTRAAAAEMQSRLFATLGRWAMAPDDVLAAELAAIEGREAPIADAGRLAAARRLFARALETPGGLKIQTIHAFCDALLRRFPLEAGVSPRFEVIDERQRALILAAIRTELALAAERDPGAPLDRIARRLDEEALGNLIDAVLSAREAFPAEPPVAARLAAHYGELAGAEPAEVARRALARLDRGEVAALARILGEKGGTNDQSAAEKIAAALAAWESDPPAAADALAAAYLTAQGEPRSRRGFPVKAVLAAAPWADALTDRLIDWAAEWRETRNALEAVARARDLGDFAAVLLERYEAAKAARALLDFDDLVTRAAGLLEASDMAAWVLWRLDRGIDHILVDEAQDTAPDQWRVIRAIAREFHAGEGAREGPRTLFVVGDEKQSIYSFQGAEIEAFAANRDHFRDWLAGAGDALAEPRLATSFRSAPGILRFVDRVFADVGPGELTVTGETVHHEAWRSEDAARIDLWPLIEPEKGAEEDEKHWSELDDRPPPAAPKLRLARILAREIARMIGRERLPPRKGRPGRQVRAGDIMVLVQKRDILARALVRRLKAEGVAVAGADRMQLIEELAVQDLLALVKVALTPADDLSLAALLRSPLVGISEEALFELAWPRPRGSTLWEALMAAEAHHPEAVAMLRDMAARADFLRPYEFLERALVRHDGRRRLLARLGREAEDAIDELLAQALAYEAREPPSLAGFIAWIEAAAIEVKREMEHGADEVRVLTVHGAKGLEAPVVILPDTMSAPGGGSGPTLYPLPAAGNRPPIMLWGTTRAEEDALTRAAREAAERRARAEHLRLLYVALTRAEDWLIIAGAGAANRKDALWYGRIERAAADFPGFEAREGPAGLPGPVRRFEESPVPVTGTPEAEETPAAAPLPELPAWAGPAPAEERPARLSPSALLPHDEVAGGAGWGEEAALRHGSLVHALLERLPAFPPAEREALARRLAAARFPDLDAEARERAIAEALGVLAADFAPRIFGPESLAEVALRIDLPGLPGQPMEARADRIVVSPGRVLVVDFKSDAAPPAAPGAVPHAYLAQLAAYAEAARAIWPGRSVEAAILWTATPALMTLDAALLAAALDEARALHRADVP